MPERATDITPTLIDADRPAIFSREAMTARLTNGKIWDIVVIGGGATGLGTAVDAASRGFQTLLLERSDFAQGTSSRSTKLAHGGVRYLQNGQFSLVIKALRERGLMISNAPHLVSMREFIVPCRSRMGTLFYALGLKLYDLLAAGRGQRRSRILDREQILKKQEGVNGTRLVGGISYFDGQFDDARYALALAQTCVREGGTVLNYFGVQDLLKEAGRVSGVRAVDKESGQIFEVGARCVINATGVFTDSIRGMDDPTEPETLRVSQGTHLVLPGHFLPGDSAIMVPKTDDGRVLFAIPWMGHVLLGTTDTPVESVSVEPGALDEEVDFLMNHASRYLRRAPKRSDVLSVFVGLRPLLFRKGVSTESIPREHLVHESESGLLTITGGKWTTYRLMAEEIVDRACLQLDEKDRPSVTRHLHIHGWMPRTNGTDLYAEYGSDREALLETIRTVPGGDRALHPSFPYVTGQVIWSARREMARTVDDVLSRRTRALFLNAKASVEVAQPVAQILSRELGRDDAWIRDQVNKFTNLAANYQITHKK